MKAVYCPVCKGSGEVKPNWDSWDGVTMVKCHNCNGEGWVTVSGKKDLPVYCEESYCYLAKGHDGLHKVMARIYDSEEDKVKDRLENEPYLPYWPWCPRWPDFNWTPTNVKDADLSMPLASDITYKQNVPFTYTRG